MDEIMTSIREIINENTALAQKFDAVPTIVNEDKRSLAQPLGASDCAKTADFTTPLSIDDAMNALAKRIGLNKPAPLTPPESMDSNHSAAATMSDRSIAPQSEATERVDDKSSDFAQKITNTVTDFAFAPKIEADMRGVAPRTESVSQQSVVAEVELAAEGVLRPIVVEWLNKNLSALVANILREELVNAFKTSK